MKFNELLNKIKYQDILEKYNYNWDEISCYEFLPENFIEYYKDKLNWEYISSRQKLSEAFIEKMQDYIDWTYFSSYHILNENILKKYENKLRWNLVSINPSLSKKIIYKYSNKLNWDKISIFQRLSEDDIEKYKDKLNWNNISEFQTLSEKLGSEKVILRYDPVILTSSYNTAYHKKAFEKLCRHLNGYTKKIKKELESFVYKPLMSICIPVYNVEEKWLRRCIDSIQNQYYTNWQICMADDCSTDKKVQKILKEYEKNNSKIDVVYRSKNGHISKATNSALGIARGEFIVLMDNDDELAPHALFEVVKLLQMHKDADVIYSDEDKMTENGERMEPYFKPDYCPDTLLSYNYISH